LGDELDIRLFFDLVNISIFLEYQLNFMIKVVVDLDIITFLRFEIIEEIGFFTVCD
jgi:hypothetical protein